MSELIEWMRPSGLSIKLKNTENLNNYAKQAGWEIASDDIDHELVIIEMEDKKDIEKYVIEVCGVDIDLRGSLETVQNKAIQAIHDNCQTDN